MLHATNCYRYVLDDRSKSEFLQIELAVIINAGELFVKATYKLESDDAPSIYMLWDLYFTGSQCKITALF